MFLNEFISMYEKYQQVLNLGTGYSFEKQCNDKYKTSAVSILMIIFSVWMQLSSNRSQSTFKNRQKSIPWVFFGLGWRG